jgi:hypothetical protein
MKRAKRTKSKSAKPTTSKSAKRTKAKSAKRAKTKASRITRRPHFTMHSGAQIVRVLQERLQPGHWANADQLQKWLIEDELAKLVHAGYVEKFGEDGMCLTDKGKAHKGPVLDIPED